MIDVSMIQSLPLATGGRLKRSMHKRLIGLRDFQAVARQRHKDVIAGVSMFELIETVVFPHEHEIVSRDETGSEVSISKRVGVQRFVGEEKSEPVEGYVNFGLFKYYVHVLMLFSSVWPEDLLARNRYDYRAIHLPSPRQQNRP